MLPVPSRLPDPVDGRFDVAFVAGAGGAEEDDAAGVGGATGE